MECLASSISGGLFVSSCKSLRCLSEQLFNNAMGGSEQSRCAFYTHKRQP